MNRCRLVFLASGRGSCFAAVEKAIADGRLPHASIELLLSDRADAPALRLAAERGIAARAVDASPFGKGKNFRRAEHEQAMAAQIDAIAPDWICLAGYMRVLTNSFVERYAGKMINIHPSLLPNFRGVRAQKQALESGVNETGCTVHLVTAELDAGPILVQKRLAVLPSDTEETLSQRLLPLEHQAYIEAVRILCEGGILPTVNQSTSK